ncbi:MAG: hypothetical protein L0Y66_07270 [Myxococcaceae bacterium]|nr:hypothetical protein [Myxococcaceae bacterium]MCI0671335.1 hypothetical protein [Myxococcaceae bacterium]
MRILPPSCALALALTLAVPARAQEAQPPPTPTAPGEASTPQQEPGQEEGARVQAPPEAVQEPRGRLDGHVREGAFLAGPGSLPFVFSNTLMGAGAGLAFSGIPNRFSLERDSRTAMLVGTLLGAGVGFGASAWYQFNNWMDQPVAYLSIFNAAVGAMAVAGVVDLFSDDSLALATSAIIGAQLGSWLTVGVGGGELPTRTALLVGSGGVWGLAYGALLLATLHTSGNRFESVSDVVPPLLIAPGIGAAAMALAALRASPTSTQILRANAFGGGVGAAVLLLSGLVAGFTTPIPYILAIVSSAVTMTAVSLLWEEAAERKPASLSVRRTKERPYRTFWW